MNNWYQISQLNIIKCLSKTKHKTKIFNWNSVESSFITHIMYLAPQRILGIKLKNGQEYMFGDVPKRVFSNFEKSPSKGQFFNNIIKKRYSLI